MNSAEANITRLFYVVLNNNTAKIQTNLSIAKASVSKEKTISDLNDLIIDSIQDIKGKNIVKLDLTELEESPTDYFIICEGDSVTQIKAISNNISKRLKQEQGQVPNHTEGIAGSQWILVDYFNTVVHIFHPESRGFYELEELWSDAKHTSYADL